MINALFEKLAAGDMRTTGKSDDVVTEVLRNPSKISALFAGLSDIRPGVRMRSADALEKITLEKPALIQTYIRKLLKAAQSSTQQEVQWHIAQIVTHVKPSMREVNHFAGIMLRYYRTSRSRIVQAFSLTALVHLAEYDKNIKKTVKELLPLAIKNGSPAVKSRAKKLILELGR